MVCREATLKAFQVVYHVRCRIRIRMMEYILITSRVSMALKRDAEEAEGFQSCRGAHGVIGAANVRIYSGPRRSPQPPQILPGMAREILGTPPLKSRGIPRWNLGNLIHGILTKQRP